jgi:hypothetical protein
VLSVSVNKPLQHRVLEPGGNSAFLLFYIVIRFGIPSARGLSCSHFPTLARFQPSWAQSIHRAARILLVYNGPPSAFSGIRDFSPQLPFRRSPSCSRRRKPGTAVATGRQMARSVRRTPAPRCSPGQNVRPSNPLCGRHRCHWRGRSGRLPTKPHPPWALGERSTANPIRTVLPERDQSYLADPLPRP